MLSLTCGNSCQPGPDLPAGLEVSQEHQQRYCRAHQVLMSWACQHDADGKVQPSGSLLRFENLVLYHATKEVTAHLAVV